MKVKLYTAKTMQDAMEQVKTDLGRDAVILHTRRLRKGGLFGFLSREMIEIMAAVDNASVATKSEPRLSRIHNEDDSKVTAIHLEIANMKKILEQVLSNIPNEQAKLSPTLELLLKNDIDLEIAQNLVKGLPDNSSIVGSDQSVVRQLLLERIAIHVQRIEGIKIPSAGRKVVALVGPTGVGKTTTIAKLAANYAVKDGYKVALITSDTYRISAVEQLKTYSEIIGVPLEIVYTPDELKAALYRLQDKNLVLIDTAGRSPSNQFQIAELQALLEADPYVETHLVLSTTTKFKEAIEIINKFSVCCPQKFLFTKIDEASNLGTLFNLVYKFPTPLSYLTNGQNVPDDIELVTPAKLANMILRD